MKNLTTTMVAACVGLASASANAVLITDWAFINEAGFDSTITTPGTVQHSGTTGAGIGIDGLSTKLTWGGEFANSSLEVDGAQNGVVQTGGAAVTGTGLTHNNFVIPGNSEPLESALLLDALQLTPLLPIPSAAVDAPILGFGVLFDETPNSQPTCPYDDGTANINDSGCADLFTIVVPDFYGYEIDGDDLVFEVDILLSDPDDLGLDEYYYTVSTRLSGIKAFDFSELDGCVGLVDKNCFGFLTREEAATRLDAEFSIEATLVSEPGTLAIFGLGLLGLAGARRRS